MSEHPYPYPEPAREGTDGADVVMGGPDNEAAAAAPGETIIPADAEHYAHQRQGLHDAMPEPVPVSAVSEREQDATMREADELRETVREKVADRMEEQQDEDEGEAETAAGGDDDLFGDEEHGDDDDEEQTAAQPTMSTSGVALPPMPAPIDGTTTAAGASNDNDNDNEEEGAQLSDTELERRRRLEYEEGEDEAAAVEEAAVQYRQIRLPKIPMASETQKIWHAKLPNFLHLDGHAFSPATWNRDAEKEVTAVPPENVIRWRWDPSATSSSPKKQTNARMVRWSDGSLSLQLGTEIFDVNTDRAVSSGKALPPPGPTVSSTSGASAGVNGATSESTTYLVAQHPNHRLLEAQALVTGNMTFRPTAIQSSSHRKLASALSGKHTKQSKTVMMMETEDPEAAAAAASAKVKKAKRAGKGAATANAASGSGRSSKTRRSVRSTRLDNFSDGGSSDEGGAGGAYGDEGETNAAAERKKQRAREQAEMEDFLASESDDDEDDDDDEDASGGRGKAGSSKRQGRSRREEEMDIEDDLDAMEAEAERAAKAAKRKKKDKAAAAAALPRPSAPVVEQNIDSDDVDADEPAQAAGKKRLVVESDEE